MVSEVGYDAESEELLIVFANGKDYSYPADRTTYQELLKAPSVGQFLWAAGLLA